MYDSNIFCMDSIDEGGHRESLTEGPAIHGKAVAGLTELASLLGVVLEIPSCAADIEFAVRRLQPGETLCRAGDGFEFLYVVRSGFLKTVSVDGAGNEQVLAFPMHGDTIGVDGFDRGHYAADAVALESCHVIVVPFTRVAGLAARVPGIERLVYSIFNRELVHRQNMVRLLGMLNAEARVANFLIDLSERFGRLGCSKSSFMLRMTRQELGSYLGIKLETVSRALSAFAASGLMEVSRRKLVLNDVEALRRKIESPAKEAEHRHIANRVQPLRPAVRLPARRSDFSGMAA